MVGMGLFLVFIVFGVGLLYFWLHSLPDNIAHKSQKIQFEIVCVLGLLAMFTHIHAFWIAGLLLALIDIPDFSSPLTRIAGALDRMAANSTRQIAAKDVDKKTRAGNPARVRWRSRRLERQ
jgi:hypothetical protein